MRFHKIIAELVDEDLVPGIDGAAGDNLAPRERLIFSNVEIASQLIWRAVNPIELLVATNDPRERKEETKPYGFNFFDLIVLLRHHIDVIATAENELRDLLEEIWRRRGRRMANDSVERRLHRAGWNFKRLQKIGANTDRDDDGHQNHFDILAPMRFPRHRSQLVQLRVQLFRAAFDFLTVALL